MLFPAKKFRILDIIETLPEIIKISLFISDSKITDSSQENNERNNKIILKSCKLTRHSIGFDFRVHTTKRPPIASSAAGDLFVQSSLKF